MILRVLRLLLAFLPLAASLAAEPKPAPHIFFLIGETEYGTPTTLPAFAKAELEPRGVRSTFSVLPESGTEEFPNFDAIKDADLLFFSVRRHAPPKAQMDAIRAHVAAGKSVVGIRTATHAFGKRKGETEGAWETFDMEVFGGHYDNHYGREAKTFAKIVAEAAAHPILSGISREEFAVPSHLYKYPKLAPTATRLLSARMEGRPEVEPLAWTNVVGKRRAFYTSMGAAEDFEVPHFRRLLLNGIHWALGLPIPSGGRAPERP